jgi:hypothetical protein
MLQFFAAYETTFVWQTDLALFRLLSGTVLALFRLSSGTFLSSVF